jgi:hypothetical protein
LRRGELEKAPLAGRFFVSPAGVPRRFTQISPLVLSTAFVLAGLLTASCSSAEPEILQIDLRVVATLTRETGEVRERLSVFADVYDQDGPEDLAWVVVEYPDLGLGWVLEEERLVYEKRGERHWYGSADLTVPGTSRVPRGTVRVVAGDLAGRSATREIRVPPLAVRLEEDDFPRLTRGDRAPEGLGGEADSGRSIVLVPAPRALRHYILKGDTLRVLEPSSESSLDGSYGYLDDDLLEQLGDEPFRLIAEYSSYLWLDSGSWLASDF